MSTEKLWVTKDGKTLKISEMEDSHLLNAIRLIRRKSTEQAMIFAKQNNFKNSVVDHKFIKDFSCQLYPIIIPLEEELKRKQKIENKITTLGLGERKIDI